MSDHQDDTCSTNLAPATASEQSTASRNAIWMEIVVDEEGAERSRITLSASSMRKDPILPGNVEVTLLRPFPMKSNNGILMVWTLSVPRKDLVNWYAGQEVSPVSGGASNV